MVSRDKIWKIIDKYDLSNLKIGVLASHSALDVFDGCVEEGFKTIAYCEKGREEPYSKYFKTRRENILKGCVDEAVILNNFKNILKIQDKMRNENVLFIPNRSLTSYVGVKEVEEKFLIPLFGSRNLLKTEEREDEKHNYYKILEKAGIPFPRKINDPKRIRSLAIIKLPHAEKRLERGFFTATSYEEYKKKSEGLIKNRVIARNDLSKARMEEYIIGPVFNLDFFYSPLTKEIELLGIDYRFETSLDGFVRLPARQQLALKEYPEYTVCGHANTTLRESLLRKVFPLAEKYVRATQKYYKPGIIGAFCLQTCVDKDLNFYCYDVAPRIGGGTNIHMGIGAPYGNALWRRPMSTGRRIALEIKLALEENRLKDVVT